MPHIRDILNEIKWTKDLHLVEIWYVHRGALHNTKVITGDEIITIGKSFLETMSATIPYHRITKIRYNGKIVFDRVGLTGNDEQL
jgi:uncharacterized protein (UPF0248 family)